MTREEIISGLKFTVEMVLLDPSTGETFTEPRNDMDKITLDACRGAIELLEQEPCEDAISRQAVLDAMYELCNTGETLNENPWRDNPHIDAIADAINNLPSVTPKPKIGYWIVDSATSSQIGIHGKKTFSYKVHCDKCGWKWAYGTDKKDSIPSNYCPNCGCCMVEPQESEE